MIFFQHNGTSKTMTTKLIDVEQDPLMHAFQMGLQLFRKSEREPSLPSNAKVRSEMLRFNLDGSTDRPAMAAIKSYESSSFIQARRLFMAQNEDGACYLRGSDVSHTDEQVDQRTKQSHRFDIYESFSGGKVVACGQLKHSGSRFYYSEDCKFILKTLPQSQVKLLVKHLPRYLKHMGTDNPNSFLIRMYGLYRVELQTVSSNSSCCSLGSCTKSQKAYVLIMQNTMYVRRPESVTLQPSSELSAEGHIVQVNNGLRVFDLKAAGLLHPRDVSDLRQWMKRGFRIPLPVEEIRSIAGILKRDVEFLVKMNVNDYSILLAVGSLQSHCDLTNLAETAQGDGSIFIGMIDILSEWHLIRKLGFIVPGLFFPRFMIPTRYGKRMMDTIDIVFR